MLNTCPNLLFWTQECLKSTFELIISNCVPAEFSDEGHPALVKTEPPFQFFNQLMEQIQSAVNDDRTMYAPLISRQVVIKIFCIFLSDVFCKWLNMPQHIVS